MTQGTKWLRLFTFSVVLSFKYIATIVFIACLPALEFQSICSWRAYMSLRGNLCPIESVCYDSITPRYISLIVLDSMIKLLWVLEVIRCGDCAMEAIGTILDHVAM